MYKKAVTGLIVLFILSLTLSVSFAKNVSTGGARILLELSFLETAEAAVTNSISSEGQTTPMIHPGDINADWRLVMSETITYLAGWQQGSNPIAYAIRAAYLWQNGETYAYDPGEEAPLCWVLSAPEEGEGEGDICDINSRDSFYSILVVLCDTNGDRALSEMEVESLLGEILEWPLLDTDPVQYHHLG